MTKRLPRASIRRQMSSIGTPFRSFAELILKFLVKSPQRRLRYSLHLLPVSTPSYRADVLRHWEQKPRENANHHRGRRGLVSLRLILLHCQTPPFDRAELSSPCASCRALRPSGGANQ